MNAFYWISKCEIVGLKLKIKWVFKRVEIHKKKLFKKKKKHNPLYFSISLKILCLHLHIWFFKRSTGSMTRGFMRIKPTNSTRFHAHPQVVDIFTRANWMNLFEKFRGFDDGISQEFSLSLVLHARTHATITIRGLSIEITPEFISRVTTLPFGMPWSKDEKIIGQATKRKFFQDNETPVQYKNGIRSASIPYPWDEVSYQVIKYISCEERHNIVYGYHFRILHDLRYGMNTQHIKSSVSLTFSFSPSLTPTPRYKCSMQRLKVKWIGLKLSPPLILGMLEGRREEEEEQWKDIDECRILWRTWADHIRSLEC